MAEKTLRADTPPSISLPSSDILSKIIKKERELELAVLQAQEQANDVIQKAKDKAAGLISAQKKAAEGEAVSIKEGLLRRAREEAEKVGKSYEQKIQAVRKIPPEALDKAAAKLLEMVLPSGGAEVEKQ